MNKKSTMKIILVAITAALFSGCSMTTSYNTLVRTEPKDPTNVYIYVDQDSTSTGFVMSGSVVRTNYMYSFATAAQKTKDAGYKYFSIVSPPDFIEQLMIRKTTNIQEAYDACDSGEDSFQMGWTYRNLMSERNRCDSIVKVFQDHTVFGGTVVHKVVSYSIKMHNNKKIGSYMTFNAEEVLESALVEGLDKEYFVKNEH